MYAYLRVVAGPDQGRIINLIEGTTLSVGRGEHSDTRLKDTTVCRLHCELRCERGEFQLVDLDSVSGTLVGGQKIQEHALKHGEEFQVGNTRMKLYSSAIGDTQKLEEAQKSAFHPAITIDETVLTGKTLSHYELGPMLRRGRFGTVYKARDTRDGKEVAINVLHADFTRDEENLKRFMRVMKIAVEVRHPNLIALRGAGKQGETCWFVREYLEGETLVTLIERLGTGKRINWRYALSMGVQVARALEALHEKHIVHRNVSPESILIRKQDKVAKLGDMMLAKVLDGAEAKAPSRPGELVGHVAYMAPEQTRSDGEVDIRADIYSLGATLYTVLTGRPPFEGKTLVDTVTKIRQDDPIPPKRFQDSIPDELQDAVEKMLAKRPELRFQTAAQAARALERVLKAQVVPEDPGKSAFIRMPSHPGSKGGVGNGG
jgi:serine/threonine protein kinase